MQSSQHSCSQRLLQFALRHLTGDRTNLLMWVQLHDINVGFEDDVKPDLLMAADSLAPPLYYTALMNIPHFMFNILLPTVDVNAQGRELGNALQAATEDGDEAVVQMLLQPGAKVNLQGGWSGMHCKRHQMVVQILIDAVASKGNTLMSTMPYGSRAVTVTIQSPSSILAAAGNTFMNLTREAQRDHKLSTAQGQGDKCQRIEVTYSNTGGERPRRGERSR